MGNFETVIKTIAITILLLLSPAPNRLLYRDADSRTEMAREFVNAGEKYNVDPILLVIWSFGESSLKMDAKGALGEVGLFQVHGRHREMCSGFDLETMRGQIECGAMLIDMDRRYCGSMERGLMRYASGRCSGTPRAKRIVKRRLKQWKRWKGNIQWQN